MRQGLQHDGDSGFVPLGVSTETIHDLPAEAARTGYLVFRAKSGFEAAVPEAVVERALAWGRQAEPNEWHGLVVGRLCEHDGRRHVVVLGVVPDTEAHGRPSSVETTAASEFRTRLSARLLYPDGIVIGWIHGHLRHGVRFSSTDKATQRSWTQPHSLGIVVDPWHRERLSVYRGPDSELLTLLDEDAAGPGELSRPAPPAGGPRGRRRLARLRRTAAHHGRRAVLGILGCAVLWIGCWAYRLGARVSALESANASLSASPPPAEPDNALRGQPVLAVPLPDAGALLAECAPDDVLESTRTECEAVP